jgi:trans-aconitate 2-methyltransferase
VTSSATQAETWSATQYVTFEDERTRPVRDLLAALPAIDARNAMDIGCGPGNSTDVLAARFPRASVMGLDSSSDMIAAARTRLPGLQFDQEDIERWIENDGAHRGAGAADGPWAGKLAAAATSRSTLAGVDWYYELLRARGCKVVIWRTTYYHALSGGAGAVVDWFKGSGLIPFMAPLNGDERADFLARYQSAVARAYPATTGGSVLLPFPRLFIVALV